MKEVKKGYIYNFINWKLGDKVLSHLSIIEMIHISPTIIERRMKTMKKKAIGTLLALMTMAALTACGTNEITEAVAMESNITVTEETGLIVEDAPVIPETIETEEPVYIDYEDLYLADNYLKVGREKLEAVDRDNLEEIYEDYVLSESVDLYNFEGTWVGYSKPNIRVVLCGTNDKWTEVSFTKTILYIPKENFDLVAMIPVEEPETEEILLAEVEEPTSKQETTPSKPKTETPVSATTEPVVVEPSTTEPIVEPETPVVDNTKYTPEEAIAVYRSIMESNGIQWDPSIKEFASWGTGWIYLTKGQAEQAGYNGIESFRMGGGDSTHPWTKYYLEVTGSDENAVYITGWHCG